MATKKAEYEKQLKRLQEIVDQLEAGELPLEKGVALYKEGLTLVKAGREQLARARNEISILARDAFEPFETEDSGLMADNYPSADNGMQDEDGEDTDGFYAG